MSDFDRMWNENQRQIRRQLRWETLKTIGNGLWRCVVAAGAAVLLFLIGRALQVW